MKIQKAVRKIRVAELRELVIRLYEAMWPADEVPEEVEWTSDTIDDVAHVFASECLHPSNLEERIQ